MKTPRVCTVITRPDTKAIRQAETMTDFFEVRIDLLGKDWQQVAQSLSKPWIATNRLLAEGGAWEGSEEGRIQELLNAVNLGAAIIDIELATPSLDEIVPRIKQKSDCLISWHETHCTPPLSFLRQIVEEELAAGADICKVVTTAQTIDDNANVLMLVHEFRHAKITAFAMGEHGRTSRILCALGGSPFTYAALDEKSRSADGQLSIAQMYQIFETLRT
ncbi:MAG: type I 3-dehydroquinate dehydratase [Dehalococcoidia bacterium]|nr:type I 3-dehydroquinate dehydratase [Dehalococcoidia bacterium]